MISASSLVYSIISAYRWTKHDIKQLRFQILRFAEEHYRDDFVRGLETFLQKIGVRREKPEMAEAMILKEATTKEKRKKILDKFIRVVCLQVSLKC